MTDQPDFKKARRRKATLSDPAKVDKLPPHSVEAEQGVLGCIMLSPADCLGVCIEKLPDSEAFYDLRHRAVFECLLSMRQDGVAIDLITLQQELKDLCQLESIGGLSYLASLPDAVPSAANLDYYLQIVLEKFTLRQTIALCTEVVSRAYDHQGEVDELVDELARDVQAITQGEKESTFKSAAELVPMSMEWAEKALENAGQITGVATGFIDFDRLTFGLNGGEVTVIAARPSTGKSAWVMGVADYVAVNLQMPVLVLSLEMSSLSLMNRMVCARARVPSSVVRMGQMNEVHYARMGASYAALKKAPLYIDDASGASIVKLQAKARRYHQQYGIKLVIIDYLQLVTAKAESRQQEVAAVSNGIKTLAKDLNVPVIVAAQLNRDTAKTGAKPGLHSIRESGAIEQDGDIVGLLYKPASEDGNDQQSSDAERVNLIIAKHRNGATAEIPLTFLKSITKFESAPPIET